MKTIKIILLTSLFSANAFALECGGTEPFWGATVSKSSVDIRSLGEPENQSIAVTSVEAASGYTSEFLQIYKNDNGPVAVVTSNKCNDSMSDYIYPKEIIIFTGSETFYGCCGDGVLEN